MSLEIRFMLQFAKTTHLTSLSYVLLWIVVDETRHGQSQVPNELWHPFSMKIIVIEICLATQKYSWLAAFRRATEVLPNSYLIHFKPALTDPIIEKNKKIHLTLSPWTSHRLLATWKVSIKEGKDRRIAFLVCFVTPLCLSFHLLFFPCHSPQLLPEQFCCLSSTGN